MAVLLRPAADNPALNGSLVLQLPDGRPVHDFRFGVVRTWQQSAEAILKGPVSLLPMALLADAPREAARSVVERINNRLRKEEPGPRVMHLLTSAFVLAGLRFETEMVDQLFGGVFSMKLITPEVLEHSSSTPILLKLCQAYEARKIIRALGTVRFGPITPELDERLGDILDPERLEAIGIRLLSVASWDELLSDQGEAPKPPATSP